MTAILFDNVSKRFVLHHEKTRSIQDLMVKTLQRRNGNGSREEFWALRDVSFQVPEGQMIGIIGPNGAGKSTALKLIARILEPTRGKITINGRLNALIELSAGFHEELTGRENIYLSAALLGYSRRDIQKHFDEIIAFSELEKFIDMQVKHYSSGMHVRLGFAIATCIESDVLLVDEVLAVGDANFQRKSFERIAEIRARGTTIVYVSHQLAEVERSCDRALLLFNGQVVADGDPADVIQRYGEMETRARSGTEGVYSAEYLSYEVPAEMRVGERCEITATVRNVSGETWHGTHGGGTRLVSLGYHWMDSWGQRHQVPGPRELLENDLAPGESTELHGYVLPPPTPGPFTLELDLMAEGFGWISRGGSLGPHVRVRVLPASSPGRNG